MSASQSTSISNTECRIYRAKILFALDKDLNEELNWLNDVSLKYLKNYQIWYVHSVRSAAIQQHFKENSKPKLTPRIGIIAKSSYHQKHTSQHSRPRKQIS